MDYKIISSGSKGNAVRIGDILVDCGVPFSKLKEELYSIKLLLLTHNHTDHIKETTYQQIRKWFPKIKTIGNYEVHRDHKVNIIANAGFEIRTRGRTITPFFCPHDVLCYGYTWTDQDQEIIYATDTTTLDNAPVKKYDYFFIESNHDEKKLAAAIGQEKGGYSPYLNGKRHLSTQQAKAFYYLNRRSQDSKFIELHKSSRFY